MIISTNSYPGTGMGSIASMLLPQGVIDTIDNLPTWVTNPVNQIEQSYGVPVAIGAGIVGLYLLMR